MRNRCRKHWPKNPALNFGFNEGGAHGQLAADYQSRVRTFFHKKLVGATCNGDPEFPDVLIRGQKVTLDTDLVSKPRH